MRPATRLLATLKGAKPTYHTPNAPTGLAGLLTHPHPRPALIYTYKQTLQALGQMPESSVYRQSVEAITKARLRTVEAVAPLEGAERREVVLARVRERRPGLGDEEIAAIKKQAADGELTSEQVSEIMSKIESTGELTTREEKVTEGLLTAEQISDIETQIGAGLIEEVIQVAEGELELVKNMITAKPWEELVEKAPEGQWSYFERGTGTEKPPA